MVPRPVHGYAGGPNAENEDRIDATNGQTLFIRHFWHDNCFGLWFNPCS